MQCIQQHEVDRLEVLRVKLMESSQCDGGMSPATSTLQFGASKCCEHQSSLPPMALCRTIAYLQNKKNARKRSKHRNNCWSNKTKMSRKHTVRCGIDMDAQKNSKRTSIQKSAIQQPTYTVPQGHTVSAPHTNTSSFSQCNGNSEHEIRSCYSIYLSVKYVVC